MPYKDLEKAREYKKKWNKEYYSSHKFSEKQRIINRKNRIREWILEYKSGLVCICCGEKTTACLDFHHLDQSKKEKSLGFARNQGWGKERILKEMKKCIVLCSNCHRKLHAGLINI
jgi:hypothetical protein